MYVYSHVYENKHNIILHNNNDFYYLELSDNESPEPISLHDIKGGLMVVGETSLSDLVQEGNLSREKIGVTVQKNTFIYFSALPPGMKCVYCFGITQICLTVYVHMCLL